LNNKQAEGILQFYKNNMEGSAQQSKIDTETAQVQSEQMLRQEWGRDFESKVKQAGALAKANINPDVFRYAIKRWYKSRRSSRNY
jgi:hypothetical protein